MKKSSLLYWIPTALLLLFMVGSGIMYFVNPAEVAKVFTELGYPVYSMYFNATAKILGGIAIVVPSVPRFLKEWAYADYLYIMLMAAQAIALRQPPINLTFMAVCILIWGLSYWQFQKRA